MGRENRVVRLAQRRSERVPDEPRAVPTHPLSGCELRAAALRGEGAPRAELGRGDDVLRVRARAPDGEVRPEGGQVHGVRAALPRRRRAEGYAECCREREDEADDPVRRLV